MGNGQLEETMDIAITGATGFLGRYLVRHLADAGHRLRCWYRPTSDRRGLEKWAHAIEWQAGSLGDPAATGALVRGVDAVVHSALEWQRQSGSRFSAQKDQERFLEVNLMGSLRLFQEAQAAGVGRFVFISTCAVHEVILDDRPLDEAHPLWPTHHYGAHKAALEKFVHSYGLGHGWPICSLRPTGIYGLAHPASDSRWFDLVGQVLRGEPIRSAKGGKEVHAADVAKAVHLLLKADAKAIAGQAFNCYDRYVSEQEVARIAQELTGSKSEIADSNRGPKHQIETKKIRALGMAFGGEALLRETVKELVEACRTTSAGR
jgi:nucleoside-diphosphate-sugar epimerase